LPSQNSTSVGSSGEDYASEWLNANGFVVKHRNYRTKIGEIDIIAEKDALVHFVEVKASKYITNSAFMPEIRVNTRKQLKLKKLCADFIARTYPNTEKHWQIDVISATLNQDGSAGAIKYFPNAIHG